MTMGLGNQVREIRNLPTPTNRDWKDNVIRMEPHRPNDTDTLARALTQVIPLLATPTTSEATGSGNGPKKTGGDNLRTQVALLPTPTAQAGKHLADDRGLGSRDDTNLWSVAGRISNGETASLLEVQGMTAKPEELTGDLPLLPTPVAQPSGNTPENHLRKKPGRKVVTDLAILVENDPLTTGGKLLPSPRASEGVKGGPNMRGSKGDLMLSSAVHRLTGETTPSEELSNGDASESGPDQALQGMREGADSQALRESTGGPQRISSPEPLQPVLREQQAGDSGGQSPMEGPTGETADQLRGLRGEVETSRSPQGQEPGEQCDGEPGDTVRELSPDASLGGRSREQGSSDVAWGPYEPAIRRWERVLDRQAPAPTEVTTKGKHRLSARFAEFMMGIPAGWVTDVDIGRNEQLKAIGNGVVPQQALAAFRDMISSPADPQ